MIGQTVPCLKSVTCAHMVSAIQRRRSMSFIYYLVQNNSSKKCTWQLQSLLLRLSACQMKRTHDHRQQLHVMMCLCTYAHRVKDLLAVCQQCPLQDRAREYVYTLEPERISAQQSQGACLCRRAREHVYTAEPEKVSTQQSQSACLHSRAREHVYTTSHSMHQS